MRNADKLACLSTMQQARAHVQHSCTPASSRAAVSRVALQQPLSEESCDARCQRGLLCSLQLLYFCDVCATGEERKGTGGSTGRESNIVTGMRKHCCAVCFMAVCFCLACGPDAMGMPLPHCTPRLRLGCMSSVFQSCWGKNCCMLSYIREVN